MQSRQPKYGIDRNSSLSEETSSWDAHAPVKKQRHVVSNNSRSRQNSLSIAAGVRKLNHKEHILIQRKKINDEIQLKNVASASLPLGAPGDSLRNDQNPTSYTFSCRGDEDSVISDPNTGVLVLKSSINIDFNPSDTILKDRHVGMEYVSITNFTNWYKSRDSDQCGFWTSGVLIGKSLELQKNSSGNFNSIWEISEDPEKNKQAEIYLSRDVADALRNTLIGAVVDITNPDLTQDPLTGDVRVLITRTEQVLYIAHAKNFGFCKAVTKNGKKCTSIVKAWKCSFCIKHDSESSWFPKVPKGIGTDLIQPPPRKLPVSGKALDLNPASTSHLTDIERTMLLEMHKNTTKNAIQMRKADASLCSNTLPSSLTLKKIANNPTTGSRNLLKFLVNQNSLNSESENISKKSRERFGRVQPVMSESRLKEIQKTLDFPNEVIGPVHGSLNTLPTKRLINTESRTATETYSTSIYEKPYVEPQMVSLIVDSIKFSNTMRKHFKTCNKYFINQPEAYSKFLKVKAVADNFADLVANASYYVGIHTRFTATEARESLSPIQVKYELIDFVTEASIMSEVMQQYFKLLVNPVKALENERTLVKDIASLKDHVQAALIAKIGTTRLKKVFKL